MILDMVMNQEGVFDYLALDNTITIDERILNKFKIKKVISLSTTLAINKLLVRELYRNIRFDDNYSKEINIKCKEETIAYMKPIFLKEKADLKIVFTSKYF